MNLQTQGTLTLNLAVTDPRLDDEEREATVIGLYRGLRSADEDLGEIRRPTVEGPPGAKAATSSVIGALTALLGVISLKPFFDYLTERWRGREITLELDVAGGHKVKMTVRTREDLMLAYNAAAALLAERR